MKHPNTIGPQLFDRKLFDSLYHHHRALSSFTQPFVPRISSFSRVRQVGEVQNIQDVQKSETLHRQDADLYSTLLVIRD